MLLAGLLASVEHGLNRVLRLDSTALARLAHLNGKVIAVDCRSPAVQLFILPSDEGLLLATQWAADADCTLRAPASSLLHLALSRNKTAILHSPEVELEGDSAVLMDLAAVLQDLELDWEYELALDRPGRHPVAQRAPAQPLALVPARVRQPEPEPRRIPERRIAHPGWATGSASALS